MERRDELAEQALDYVLAHGLIGLSLRPLAAELGTSDRMLLYHFTSKERLVEEVLARAQHRLAASINPAALKVPDTRALIRALWASLSTSAATSVTRLYLETCMLAVQDPARWSASLQRLRGPWRPPLREGLLAFGLPPDQVDATVDLILATLDGLALDRLTTGEGTRVDASAAAFADLFVRADRA